MGPSQWLSCHSGVGMVIQFVVVRCLSDPSMLMRVLGTYECVPVRPPPPIETLRGVVLLHLVVFRIVVDGLAHDTLHRLAVRRVSNGPVCVEMGW